MKETGKRRPQLADFLKTRRARLRPEQFDLPTYPRRRNPGLRREELAQLVGVGVSWYTWLEQGRKINVSDQILSRLADVLQLNEQERNHLFLLARGSLSGEQNTDSLEHLTVYQALLDGWGLYPALLVDHRLNVVAWNESANRVFGDFSSRSDRDRNAIWSIFTEPSQRERLVNWEQAARRSIALLRTRSDRHANEAWFQDLISDLHRASPEFRAWWPEHDILFTCHDLNELNHPLIGPLMFQGTTLVVPERPDLQIVVHTPLSQFNTTTKLRAFMAGESQSI